MTISQEIQNLTSAVQTLTDAVKKLKLQSSQKCCPEPIYNCETGNVTWIYPPADGGGMDGSTGDVTITDDPADPTAGDGTVGSDGTIGGYDGNAGIDHGGDAGFGIDYDDPSVQPPSTTGANDWQEFDDGLCIKANWVVLAVRDVLEQGMSITGWTAGAISSVQTLISVLGAAGIVGDTFVGVAVGASALTMSMPLAIGLAVVASIASLLILASKQAVLDLYDALREELVCAVYNGKSAAGIKKRWDSVINSNTEWFAPQRAWIKYLMTPDLSAGLSLGNPDDVVDLPRYDYPCDCNTVQCAIGTYHINTVTCYYWHASNRCKHSALIEWVEGDPCVHWNNEYDIGFRSTLNTAVPPWDDGDNGRGAYCWQKNDGAGLQIRLTENLTPQYAPKLYYWGASTGGVLLPTDGSPVTVPQGTTHWIVGYVHGAFANFTPDFTIIIEAI